MSARSPFRSHLLQQWTQSRRSPVVVQQWLQQAKIDEEAASSRPASSSRRNQMNESHRPPRHTSIKSLSSVESSSSPSSKGLSATLLNSSIKYKDNENELEGSKRTSVGGGSSLSGAHNLMLGIDPNTVESERLQDDNYLRKHHRNDFLLHSKIKSYPDAIRKMMTPREIATNELAVIQPPPGTKSIQRQDTSGKSLFTKTKYPNDEMGNLQMLIGRAVKTSLRMAPRNPAPFSFRRFFSSSQSGQQLIDMRFQLTWNETGDKSMAMNERKKWAEVQAFLVTLVHNNQSESAQKDCHSDDRYQILDYSPPVEEDQLEDYGSACAATRSVMHSLGEDGIASTSSTCSIIKTPAFRSLVKAKPTDRIAALIMVHGLGSSTHSRRPRRHSSAKQNLLVDLA